MNLLGLIPRYLRRKVLRRVDKQGYRLPTRYRNAWAQQRAHPTNAVIEYGRLA